MTFRRFEISGEVQSSKLSAQSPPCSRKRRPSAASASRFLSARISHDVTSGGSSCSCFERALELGCVGIHRLLLVRTRLPRGRRPVASLRGRGRCRVWFACRHGRMLQCGRTFHHATRTLKRNRRLFHIVVPAQARTQRLFEGREGSGSSGFRADDERVRRALAESGPHRSRAEDHVPDQTPAWHRDAEERSS